MEAPARREATTTTDDHASEGVPVGTRPPPNFFLPPPPFILLLLPAGPRVHQSMVFFRSSLLSHRFSRRVSGKLKCHHGIQISCSLQRVASSFSMSKKDTTIIITLTTLSTAFHEFGHALAAARLQC
uniref:Uncharacterized protein n=1 Tax=Aegilops tauschii TaxID=37682 RepID=M8CAU5_AEGTA